MMFFKKKPAWIKMIGVAAPKPAARNTAEFVVKAIRKPDSDGRLRRMLRTVEDNRLL